MKNYKIIIATLTFLLLYIRAPSFILNFPLAHQNFTTALLSFLFLSAIVF